MNRPATAAFVAYTALSAALILARAFGKDELAEVLQWFAMPLLIGALWAATRVAGASTRCVAAGLGFSWMGDVLPDLVPQSAAFIVLMLSFLLAHAAYITAFWPHRPRWRNARPWALAYAVAAAIMMAAVAPEAGWLLPGIGLYAAALASTATLATGLGTLGALGGLLFVVSDSLIAGGEFIPWLGLPVLEVWVMAPYLTAQAFIVIAVIATDSTSRSEPGQPLRPTRQVSPAH